MMTQIAGDFEDGRSAAQEQSFSIVNQRRRRLTDAPLFLGLEC